MEKFVVRAFFVVVYFFSKELFVTAGLFFITCTVGMPCKLQGKKISTSLSRISVVLLTAEAFVVGKDVRLLLAGFSLQLARIHVGDAVGAAHGFELLGARGTLAHRLTHFHHAHSTVRAVVRMAGAVLSWNGKNTMREK